MSKREVILIRETLRDSVIRDLTTVICFVAMIGIGVWLDSSALQWIGAFLGFIAIMSRSINLMEKSRYSIEEARRRLDELERQA